LTPSRAFGGLAGIPKLMTNMLPVKSKGGRRLVLPNFTSRGRLALPDFCGLFKIPDSNGFQNRKCGKGEYSVVGDIKSQITPEKLLFYGKEQLLYYCKELRLKTTGEKKDLIERLSPFGKCPYLFDKKSGTNYR